MVHSGAGVPPQPTLSARPRSVSGLGRSTPFGRFGVGAFLDIANTNHYHFIFWRAMSVSHAPAVIFPASPKASQRRQQSIVGVVAMRAVRFSDPAMRHRRCAAAKT